MNVPHSIVPVGLRVLDAVSPRVAAYAASAMFWRLGRPASVREVDREIHEAAAVEHLVVGGTPVAVYTWGTGDSVILLVHGWKSRASRFSSLVRALTSDDRTIVTFDAPGHGASGTGPSNALEWARIIRELDARYGPFDATVAHSFGVLAAFHAARIGISTGRIAAIAGVHSLEHLVTNFTRTIQLPRRAQVRFRDRINRQVFVTSSFAWDQIVSEVDPGSNRMPLLVVHDSADVIVGIDQARLIAGAHTGPTSVMYTEGLGHNRILADSRVVDAVTEFVSTHVEPPVRTSVDHENGVSSTTSGIS